MATPLEEQTIQRQLGRLEGRMEEQSAAIQQMGAEILQLRADLTTGLAAVNARIDRLLFATMALGGGLLAGLIGLIATLIVVGA